METVKPVVLYDSKNRPIAVANKGVNDLDVGFLHGFISRNRNDISEITNKPYPHHSWTYACVHAISQNISQLKKKIVIENADGETKDILRHPALKVLRRPNPFMTGRELFEAISLYLNLPTLRTPGGQVFLLPESGTKGKNANLAKGEIPREFWPFSDEFMEPIKDNSRIVIGWKLIINGKTINEYHHTELIRIRRFNPDSMALGLAPYNPVRASITQDVKADIYNTLYYDNQGAIGGLLSSDQELTREQKREALDSWMEEYGGAGNNGKTAVLGLGIKYEQFAQKLVDMQFSEQRLDNRKRIQAVYGVPDAEIGIFESGMNRATAEQADRNFWQKTLIPLDGLINEAITVQWIDGINPDFELESDLERVQALIENQTEKIENAKKLFDMRVPPAEALRVTRVPVDTKGQPQMDVALANSMLVDANLIVASGGQVIDIPPEDKKPDADEEKAKKDSELEEILKEKRRILSDLYIRTVLTPGEKSLVKELTKFFNELKREMLDNVDAWIQQMQGKTVKQIILSPSLFLFDKNAADTELETIYTPEVGKQMKRSTAKVSEELDGLVNWSVQPEFIMDFVSMRRNMLKTINTTTFKAARHEIANIISDGVRDNLTANELAVKLKEGIRRVSGIRVNNAVSIARTEIGTISDLTRDSAFKAEGIKQTEWLSSRDALVRVAPFDHTIDGEIIEIGETYSNELHYPHDPSGQAGNVINCRCVSLAVIK